MLLRLLKNGSGVTAIEYGLVAVAAVTVTSTVGTNLSSTFNTLANSSDRRIGKWGAAAPAHQPLPRSQGRRRSRMEIVGALVVAGLCHDFVSLDTRRLKVKFLAEQIYGIFRIGAVA